VALALIASLMVRI